MKPIIKADGLGKKYHLGRRETVAPTLREALKDSLKSAAQIIRRRNGSDPIVWALNDVSFEVWPGEVVGIIGRNGAGKSTLLRILARITRPTTGLADLYGRTGAKRYSSGMYLRLGFAIAAHLEPDILLLDEVLTIADASFQKKCLQKIKDVSRDGTTVLFVSHNLTSVEQVCDRALHIEGGRLFDEGKPEAVMAKYLKHIAAEQN